MEKKLKSGEKIKAFDRLDNDEYIVVQIYEHGPWCKGGCLQEGGCSGMFFNSDIENGDVFDVFKHPENFVLERDSHGEPIGIKRVE